MCIITSLKVNLFYSNVSSADCHSLTYKSRNACLGVRFFSLQFCLDHWKCVGSIADAYCGQIVFKLNRDELKLTRIEQFNRFLPSPSVLSDPGKMLRSRTRSLLGARSVIEPIKENTFKFELWRTDKKWEKEREKCFQWNLIEITTPPLYCRRKILVMI